MNDETKQHNLGLTTFKFLKIVED